MRKVILNDVIDIISGGTPKTSVSEYWNGDIGWLSVIDFNNDYRKVYKSEKTITQLGLNNSSTKMLNAGDIIISARGTVGALAQIGTPMCFNQSCFGLRGKNAIIDNDYLYYALKNYMVNLKKRTQGSVFETINLDSFKLMGIDIYENIKTQKEIIKILSKIDDKIELNNKINEELEKLAKTLYDYWFVQFDFPDENERPYKSSGGKMKKSDILKKYIPENWSEGKLFDYIENEKGGDWGKDEPQGNYSLQVKCFRGADIPTMNTCCVSEAPIRYINKNNSFKILSNTDIIIEISGGSPVQSTGRIAYINNELLNRYDSNLITSNFCKAVSLKSAKYVYNFYLEWKTLYNQGVFFNYEGKTTGIKNLLYDDFINSYKTVIPDKNTIEKFYKIVEPIFNQIQINCKEAIRLIQLRDFLLPMLMNGQVTIQN